MPSVMSNGFMRDSATGALVISGGPGSFGKSSVIGTGSIISARNTGANSAFLGLGNSFLTGRNAHTATVACSDIRLVFSGPITSELSATYPTFVKAGIEVSGAVYPVTFGGRSFARLEPGARTVISDPVPIDLTAGQAFWTRVHSSTPFGLYTSTTAANSIGDSTIALTALPGLTALDPVSGYLGAVTLDTGGNAETVTIKSYSGLTATLASTLTKAHASGALVGQAPFTNGYSYSDLGEGNVNSGTLAGGDLSWASTVISPTTSYPTITLLSSTLAGATSLTAASPLQAGKTFTIDTAGNQETFTVKTITGTANPYTYQLTAPLTFAHSAGVTITGGLGLFTTLRPLAITADRVAAGSSAPATVLGVGDSITAGTGYNVRNERSYFTLAFQDIKPFISVALAGESAQQFVAMSGSYRRRSLLSSGAWMFYEYGVNDIYGGRTLAQFQADTLTVWSLAYNRGLKVAASTLTPRTTSSDTWATTVNQTVSSSAFNTIRVNYNNWLRAGAPIVGGAAVAVGTAGATLAGSASHPLTMTVELADSVESARDSGLWRADASGPYTADGIHPTDLGHTLMAAAINPALFV